MRTPRIRRPRLSYANVTATLALVIATSMGGAYAHGMIGSNQIKNNAVKSKHIAGKQVKTGDLAGGAVATAKLKNKAVKLSKLAPANRPTHVTQWRFGAHDFVAENALVLTLPSISKAKFDNSAWEAAVLAAGPGVGFNVPLAYGDTSTNPVLLMHWVAPGVLPGHSGGAVAAIIDNSDEFDSVTVTGIRLTQTQRFTAVKAAGKLAPRVASRLPRP